MESRVTVNFIITTLFLWAVAYAVYTLPPEVCQWPIIFLLVATGCVTALGLLFRLVLAPGRRLQRRAAAQEDEEFAFDPVESLDRESTPPTS